MHLVHLGLGSNLGDRVGHLRRAVSALSGAGLAVEAVSSVFETDPIGGPAQDDFLNIVVRARTELAPTEVLAACHAIEQDARRVRTQRWGPRTLDVDVLLIDDLRIDTETLTVPHPRMWERRFVLAPLAEISPELVPAEALASAVGAVRVAGELGT